MKTFIPVCLIVLHSFLMNAQTENAIYFDGIDDNITIPNASALISNSNQISMSCWVYPENFVSTFPDYDGFCGFRNNIDADFYLIQIPGNQVEARFRSSSGTVFDIVDSSLQLNAWQHYVLTYSGTELALYRNGILSGTISASGTISNSTQTFYIGDLIFNFNDFFLLGKIDEVSLWNKSLTAFEIKCIYESNIDSASIGLALYYKFNQGVAGGINGSVNILQPQTGILNGALNNFSLFGPTSNWVGGIENFSSVSATICDGQTYVFGSQSLTLPGIYNEAFNGTSGCDSLVRLTLDPAVVVSVTYTHNLFTADQSGAAYQWINCNNGHLPISGETAQSFTPVVDGDYAVIVTYNGCTDTSICYNWIHTSIQERERNNFDFFPNPAYDKIYLTQPFVKIIITDLTGRELSLIQNDENGIDVSFLKTGLYYLKIINQQGTGVQRLIKK